MLFWILMNFPFCMDFHCIELLSGDRCANVRIDCYDIFVSNAIHALQIQNQTMLCNRRLCNLPDACQTLITGQFMNLVFINEPNSRIKSTINTMPLVMILNSDRKSLLCKTSKQMIKTKFLFIVRI